MASGDGKDSATLAIAHRQYADSQIKVDTVYEVRPQFNSEDVVRQFSEVLRLYRCSSVVGDQYAKGWCRAAFARHGIEYTENAPIKSDIYLHCISLFTANKVNCRTIRGWSRNSAACGARSGWAARRRSTTCATGTTTWPMRSVVFSGVCLRRGAWMQWRSCRSSSAGRS